MVGGLALSQLLTLYTTPVIYLYLDRLQRSLPRLASAPPIAHTETSFSDLVQNGVSNLE